MSTSSPSNKPAPARYKATNWTQYNAALKRRGSLLVWIDPTTQWYANSPSGRAGRDRIFSDAAIQCCLTLSGRCLNRFTHLGMPETVRVA